MKFLLDAHLSWRLVKKLQTQFFGTIHVNQTGLEIPADDKDIWEFAKRNDFVILTFDEDFLNLSLRYGQPPKVVMLRSFDQTSDTVMRLLNTYRTDIEAFYNSVDDSLLQIVSK